MTSKYLGVSWNKKQKKWQVHIWNGVCNVYLGSFDNELIGRKSYCKARKYLNKKPR